MSLSVRERAGKLARAPFILRESFVEILKCGDAQEVREKEP